MHKGLKINIERNPNKVAKINFIIYYKGTELITKVFSHELLIENF